MINTREIAEEYRLSHWSQIMQERVQSGLTVKAFCKQIGICENTYFYWQRRVRAAVCEQLVSTRPESISTNLPVPSFTEVSVVDPATPPAVTKTSKLRIEVGNIQMTADSTYPPDKLAALLREMSRPC